MTPELTLASIVVNNYNYARFLGSAIDSALAQTYAPFEVVVVDDGSTDESRALIESYGDRIIPVLQSNGGQGSALNAGFAASQGEVVVFLDSDDVMLPTAVARAMALMMREGVAKVHWPLWEVDADGNRTGRMIPSDPLPEGDFREMTLREGTSRTGSSPTSGNAWARSFLERVMPIPATELRLSADAYLFGLAPAFGLVASIPEPQGSYRVHGRNNYSGTPLALRLETGHRVVEQQWRALNEYCLESGVGADLREWERHSYFHQLKAALGEIERLVPAGQPFILADEERWAADDTVDGRPRIPFLERDGVYWGKPLDDETAISELERLRAERGATFLVIAWPAFWWLEYYDAFAAHLRSAFPCVLANERLIVFDLEG
ncbi:MAG: glycosyltransferase family 2 protein [Gemmatimonadaceae bacterium]|nr:glycosyltransferase family 2 protein [Gemmatimonadaceae bacterium]